MSRIIVTLANGKIIEFDRKDVGRDVGTSYQLDPAGVLTIESKCAMGALGKETRQQRFSPAAWSSIEEIDTFDALSGVVVGGVVGGAAHGYDYQFEKAF